MTESPLLTLFLDEAGDPGAHDGLSYLPGRYEWLCLGGYLIRTEREPETVEWVRELRYEVKATQAPALHYHRVNLRRREQLCRSLASRPARAFCVLSHKSNLREYHNPKLGRFSDPDKLYNWCIRLLLERVTEWCRPLQTSERGGPEPIRIVFSERGGHDYDHLFSYLDMLNMQYDAGRMKLAPRHWSSAMVRTDQFEIVRADAAAGLQLADVIASSFHQSANTAHPHWDIAPASALEPVVAKDEKGSAANMGVTVWPLRHQAPVPEGARPIFEKYGYVF